MKHSVVKANDQVIGVEVRNLVDERLGKIKEVMLDKISGQVAYVVLDSGSFLGFGGKYFAFPWDAFHYDAIEDCFRVDIDEKRLENAPGFDKNNWPDRADRAWVKSVYTYYGRKAYWE